MNNGVRPAALIVSLLLTFAMAFAAHAQVSGKAFGGFSSGGKDPISIDADELEIVDQSEKATFSGNVVVRQGGSTMTTKKLVVHYESGGGGNKIERLEMLGSLVVTQGDDAASADRGTYNMKTEIVVLEGNVVVTQGTSAAKGCKLTANLKTNKAVLAGCGGRVKSVFTPGSVKPTN